MMQQTRTIFQRVADRVRSEERGISMIAAIMALMVGMLLAAAAFATANSGIELGANDRWQRLAYQRAQSGLANYVRRLATDPNYWSACDRGGLGSGSGLGTTAVNDTIYGAAYDSAYGLGVGAGGHEYRRWLPWSDPGSASDLSTTGQYTIDLIPTNGATACGTTDEALATERMVNERTATFRIRVTGRAGRPVSPDVLASAGTELEKLKAVDQWRSQHWKKVSLVAEFRRAGFLDYVYFTDHEAIDPSYINQGNKSLVGSVIAAFNPPNFAKCDDYYRYTDGSHPGRESLESAGWVCPTDRPVYNNEEIRGPIHSNDSISVQSTSGATAPLFGNANMGDRVEIYDNGKSGNACTAGQRGGGCACPFRVVGKFLDTNLSSSRVCSKVARMNTGVELITGPEAKKIEMPSGNSELKQWAGPPPSTGYLYTGKTTITLHDNGKFDVNNPGRYVATGLQYPPNGVIYVQNDESAPSCVSDPDANYQLNGAAGGMPSTNCALVEVKGTYNKSLTIGSEGDIVVTGDVKRAADTTALLGLVANNYIRVRHYATTSGNTDNYYRHCVYKFTNWLDIFGVWGFVDFVNCLRISNGQGILDLAGQLTSALFSGQPLEGWTCASDGVTGTPVKKIQAAILALRRSFTVDGSQCGQPIGSVNDPLVINGAMTQNWRGAITGQDWSHVFDKTCNAPTPSNFWEKLWQAIVKGFLGAMGWCNNNNHSYVAKQFDYDYLLRALSPPHFLSPQESAWRINRLRQTIPACDCGPTG